MASVADLAFRESTGNLGGVMTATEIVRQTAVQDVPIPGVTLICAQGTPQANLGADGVLNFNQPANQLEFNAPGAGVTTGTVALSGDGRYFVPADAVSTEEGLIVSVTTGSLPGSTQSANVTVADAKNNLFDDISIVEEASGDVEYRAFYILNAHASDVMVAATAFVAVAGQPTGNDTLAIGLDPAGIGDGSVSGIMVSIVDESTAPVGVVFTAPTTVGTGLVIGNLSAGDAAGIWIQRTVPAGAGEELNNRAYVSVSITV